MKSPLNKFTKEELNKPLNLYFKLYLIGIALLPIPMLFLSFNLSEKSWLIDKLFMAPLIYVWIWTIFFMLKQNWNIFKK